MTRTNRELSGAVPLSALPGVQVVVQKSSSWAGRGSWLPAACVDFKTTI